MRKIIIILIILSLCFSVFAIEYRPDINPKAEKTGIYGFSAVYDFDDKLQISTNFGLYALLNLNVKSRYYLDKNNVVNCDAFFGNTLIIDTAVFFTVYPMLSALLSYSGYSMNINLADYLKAANAYYFGGTIYYHGNNEINQNMVLRNHAEINNFGMFRGSEAMDMTYAIAREHISYIFNSYYEIEGGIEGGIVLSSLANSEKFYFSNKFKPLDLFLLARIESKLFMENGTKWNIGIKYSFIDNLLEVFNSFGVWEVSKNPYTKKADNFFDSLNFYVSFSKEF